jgi:hypothetical protein
MLAKFDKLSDIKKQQVIRDIENKSGISLDSIENQIITGENISVGLHEAGHLKDMQHGENLKLMARKWAPKLSYGASIYGAASNSAAAKLIRKGTLPLMIAGQLPALIQEFKASNTAYQEIKKQLGEDEANKRLVKELAPMFASHVSGSIIEPYILSQILGIAVKKMLANLMAKRAEEQASLEVFEKTATQILEDLL